MISTPPTSPTLPVGSGSKRAAAAVTTPNAKKSGGRPRYPISPVCEGCEGCEADDAGEAGDGSMACLEADLRAYPALSAGVDGSLLCPRFLDLLCEAGLTLSAHAIGHGSYSYVFEIVGRGLALKFPISKKKSPIILREAEILSRLEKNNGRAHHIVPFVGVTYINKTHYKRLRTNECVPGIMMPKFDMNLRQFYEKQAAEGDAESAKQTWWRMCTQALDCLKFLKENRIIHGDIKTANILIDAHQNIYLADFTSSKEIVDDHIVSGSSIESTMEYCAPEMIEHSTESFDTDLYAMGLCLLSLITKGEPFQELQKCKNHGISFIHQTQWLVAAILKREPIKLNVLDNDEIRQIWANELRFLTMILSERVSIECCIDSISQFLHL